MHPSRFLYSSVQAASCRENKYIRISFPSFHRVLRGVLNKTRNKCADSPFFRSFSRRASKSREDDTFFFLLFLFPLPFRETRDRRSEGFIRRSAHSTSSDDFFLPFRRVFVLPLTRFSSGVLFVTRRAFKHRARFLSPWLFHGGEGGGKRTSARGGCGTFRLGRTLKKTRTHSELF